MFELDQQLFLWLNAGPHTPAWVIVLARAVCDVLPALVVGALGLWMGVHRARRQALGAALAAMWLAWVVVRLARFGLPMPRPAMFGLGTQWAEQGARPGFPSMHATTLFAFAAALRLSGQSMAGGWMLGLAAAVALCRLVLGLHFPSDVTAGAVLGCALAWLVVRTPLPKRLTLPRGRRRLLTRGWARRRDQALAFFSRGTRPIR